MKKSDFFIRKVGFVLSLFILSIMYGCSSDDSSEPLSSNEEEIIERVDMVNKLIEPIFLHAEGCKDLVHCVDELKACEEVDDAWIESETLYAKIKDGGIVFWTFAPKDDRQLSEMMMSKDSLEAQLKVVMDRVSRGDNKAGKNVCKNTKFCLINQQSSDLSRENYKRAFELIAKTFEESKFFESVTMINQKDFTSRFIVEEMPNYGVIFMVSHGALFTDKATNKGYHWFLTGMEFNVNKEQFDLWKKNVLMAGNIKERRTGYINKSICYLAVSEEFIRKQTLKKYPENSILFNTSCESLKNGDNLAHAFLDNGLGCYLGYDKTNAIGKEAGPTFYEYMWLGQKNVSEAFEMLPENYKTDPFEGKNAKLKVIPEGSKISFYEEEELEEGQYVDLGLSVLWATCNLGVNKPELLGEKQPKIDLMDVYAKDSTLCVYEKNNWPFISLRELISVNICGSHLDPAAKQGVGRLPTRDEMDELITKCKISADVVNGVGGLWAKGPNGNSVFLPAPTVLESGFYIFDAQYWTGSYDREKDQGSSFASLFFVGGKSGAIANEIFTNIEDAENAYVRPVCDKR